jgi:hypothetical protein
MSHCIEDTSHSREVTLVSNAETLADVASQEVAVLIALDTSQAV